MMLKNVQTVKHILIFQHTGQPFIFGKAFQHAFFFHICDISAISVIWGYISILNLKNALKVNDVPNVLRKWGRFTRAALSAVILKYFCQIQGERKDIGKKNPHLLRAFGKLLNGWSGIATCCLDDINLDKGRYKFWRSRDSRYSEIYFRRTSFAWNQEC